MDTYVEVVVGNSVVRELVSDAPAPVPPAVLSPLAFLRRFTADERVAIRGSVDPYVQDFYHLLDKATEVRLDDPDTVAGMGYLVSIGLLTQPRADAILEG